MKIAITGCSGFVGTWLTKYLIDRNHRVTGIDAVPAGRNDKGDAFHFIQADTTQPGDWQQAFEDVDAVVNLAGKNIFHLWSDKYKELIYNTRILTTRNVVAALPRNRNIALVSTSAAGFYGDRGEEVLDESKPPGDDFLARVCVDWEQEALAVKHKGVRVIVSRFGVVLGKNGGALAKMLPAYRMFVGGPLGNGLHWFPWIHMADLLAAIEFVIMHREIEGPMNFCSPNPVRNGEFSKALASALGRPAFMRTPAFLLKLLAGELGGVLLSSQRAVSTGLLSHGFRFQYPDVSDAIRASL
ncbi:MAG: TIGR01777 family oxidoreductase [Desulfosalsimonadaceae bacterium]|nr:TIGR01777 family oxidoreductase [Desulfosalsimonadaceae bacterium]